MKLVVTGGGTGGHIYPALALIKYIKQVEPKAQVLYIGTQKGLEHSIVPEQGIPFETVDVQGFRRSLSLENFRTVYKFLTAKKAAKQLLKTFKPDVVIGTGGYVAGPVVGAASSLKIPTIIHEQNSIPGITNKYLAKKVTKIAVAFNEASKFFPEDKTVFTGNPRAQEVADIEGSKVLAGYGLKPDKRTLVIFGGSRGALKINQALVEALPLFAQKDYQVVYASGERYWQDYQAEFETYNARDNIVIKPYISNMNEVLASADLILSRAGATTLAEITALGLPAILVPSPYVTADHQTKNAQALEKVGAAVVIADSELTGARMVEAADRIFGNNQVYQDMSAASLDEGMPDASTRLYQLIKEIAHD